MSSTKDIPVGEHWSEVIERLLKENTQLKSRLKPGERSEKLALEVEMLRRYGNKDCTAQADEALLACYLSSACDRLRPWEVPTKGMTTVKHGKSSNLENFGDGK